MGARVRQGLGWNHVPFSRMLDARLQRRQRQLDQSAQPELHQPVDDGAAAGEGHHLNVADVAEEEAQPDEAVPQLPREQRIPFSGRTVVLQFRVREGAPEEGRVQAEGEDCRRRRG